MRRWAQRTLFVVALIAMSGPEVVSARAAGVHHKKQKKRSPAHTAPRRPVKVVELVVTKEKAAPLLGPEPIPPAPTATTAASALAHAVALTQDPAHRREGISLLQSFMEAPQASAAAARALARALSWEGRHEESLRVYDTLIRTASVAARTELEVERLEVLLWQGRTGDAEAGYTRLLEDDPTNAAALVGRSRALRWLGRPLAARSLAESAVELHPERPDIREELAWSYLDLGLPHAAEAALGPVRTATSSAMFGRFAELRNPRLSTTGVYSESSAGIARFASSARAVASIAGDLDVLVGIGMTYIEQRRSSTPSVDCEMIGLGLGVPMGPMRLQAIGAAVLVRDQLAFDVVGRAVIRPIDELGFAIGARHRPLIEQAEPFAIDDQVFNNAGVGGALELDQALGLAVDDFSASFDVRPFSSLYLYGDGHRLTVDDGNIGYSASAGLGFDILGLFELRSIALYAKWDTFVTGFDRSSDTYYSPALLDVHSIGAELRVGIGSFAFSVTGGQTIGLVSAAPLGWFAGGGIRWATRHILVLGRGDYRADPFYRSWRGWLAVEVRP